MEELGGEAARVINMIHLGEALTSLKQALRDTHAVGGHTVLTDVITHAQCGPLPHWDRRWAPPGSYVLARGDKIVGRAPIWRH